MALIPMKEILVKAQKERYAVGYFESWNLESLQSVINAAEEECSPVIVGFSGRFLAEPGRLMLEKIEYYASMGKVFCENTSVPTALILNEVSDFTWIEKAIELGFTAIMYEDESLSAVEEVNFIKKAVKIGHSKGVSVEAQFGVLPTAGKKGVTEETTKDISLTDSEKAAQFVKEIGIDALSISVGNIHSLISGKAEIDFDRLKDIRGVVDIPLVLHGGTGLADDTVRRAIKLGICKINVGTLLKQAFIKGIKKKLGAYSNGYSDVHEFLGSGKERDILMAGALEMRDVIKEKMKVYGSSGRV